MRIPCFIRKSNSKKRVYTSLPVTLIGYARGDFGVAENLRSIAGSLSATSSEYSIYEVTTNGVYQESDSRYSAKISSEINRSIEIVCVNADQTPRVVSEVRAIGSGVNYRVGIWFWELERFPDLWMGAFDYVDEIWAPSQFIFDNLRKISPKPVIEMPVAVDFQSPDSMWSTRRQFNIPNDKFIFMFSFDCLSFPARKNPFAVIRAFHSAFPADSEVGLVIKISNSRGNNELVGEVKRCSEIDPRIVVIDDVLSRNSMYSLLAAVDCYVSLHRSEGFGLGMAEAMLLGKPVIATGYSGNTTFMNTTNSCLVGYKLVDVLEGQYPFWERQRWAEADVNEASAYMLRIKGDLEFRDRISRNARDFIRTEHSFSRVGRAIRDRLTQIEKLV